MSNEILFVASIFITRIVLPIIATCILGGVIERALNREARANAYGAREVYDVSRCH